MEIFSFKSLEFVDWMMPLQLTQSFFKKGKNSSVLMLILLLSYIIAKLSFNFLPS